MNRRSGPAGAVAAVVAVAALGAAAVVWLAALRPDVRTTVLSGTAPPTAPAPATPTRTPDDTASGTVTAAPTPAGSATVVHPTTTTPAATPAATRSRTVSPGTRTLTEDDAGRTVHVTKGTTIAVRLAGSPGFPWSAVESSDPGTVRRTESSVTDGTATARLLAVAAGRATLSSANHPTCRDSTPPCGAPDRLWQVTVVVA